VIFRYKGTAGSGDGKRRCAWLREKRAAAFRKLCSCLTNLGIPHAFHLPRLPNATSCPLSGKYRKNSRMREAAKGFKQEGKELEQRHSKN